MTNVPEGRTRLVSLLAKATQNLLVDWDRANGNASRSMARSASLSEDMGLPGSVKYCVYWGRLINPDEQSGESDAKK